MARHLLAAALTCCVLTAAAAAKPVRFDGTGNYYEAVYSTMRWYQAVGQAAARSFTDDQGYEYTGRLVTVNSQAESDFIAARFPLAAREGGFWIGAYQQAGSTEPDGGWCWVSGEPFDYTNWGAGEPNNNSGTANENCIHLNSSAAEWNDLPMQKLRGGYVVEYVADNRPPVADAGGPYAETADGVFVEVTPGVINVRGGGAFITAWFTADPDAEAEVSLDGTGSSDPDGDDLTYAWTVLDGDGGLVAIPTGPNPTLSLGPGSYTVRLVVSDGRVDSEPDTTELEVIALDLAAISAGDVTACGPVGDPVPGLRCSLDEDGNLMVKFDRQALIPGLEPDVTNVITLGGAVTGQDTVDVINPGNGEHPGNGNGGGNGKSAG